MNFTMTGLEQSLADYLSPQLPGTSIYADPNQQGTKPPALFLRPIYAKIAPQISGMVLRKLGLDLVYLVQPNGLNIDSTLRETADVMDLCLETFPYAANSENPVHLRTYDRHWDIIDSALHYRFQLRLRLSKAEDFALMESIQELNMEENHERT